MGSQQDGFSVPWKGAETIQVEVKRLDEMIGPSEEVLLLNIDAQGYDKDVLYGADALLKSHRIAVVLAEFAVGLIGKEQRRRGNVSLHGREGLSLFSLRQG